VSDLLELMAEYRAGLEAEVALLRHLATLAARQREMTESGRLDTLDDITDARNQIMTALISLEARLRPLRHALPDPVKLMHRQEFRELTALHEEAAELADAILASDAQSLAALHEADLARRFDDDSLEKSESTLAAYRRVVMPSIVRAALVHRRG
jgi:hypothetical protein